MPGLWHRVYPVQRALVSDRGYATLSSDSIPLLDYRRRLPHEFPAGKALFLTWHLHGSLPRNRYPPPGKRNSGRAFVWVDHYLDSTRNGPLYLRQAEIASLVVDSLRHGATELRFYDLDAFVVMPNHVHLLATPRVAPPLFLKSIKNYTAREANLLLGRTGKPFWQAESYDHWVRHDEEHRRIQAYIEENLVRAGLVGQPRAYHWSSAYRRP